MTISNIIRASPTGSFEFDAVSGAVSNHIRVDARTGLTQSTFPYTAGQNVKIQGVGAIFKGIYQLKPRGLSDFSIAADTVAPVTTSALSSAPNGAGWFKEDVTVTLTAVDDRAGAVVTQYAINGGASAAYTAPITVQSERNNNSRILLYGCCRQCGSGKSLQMKLDKTAPAATLTESGHAVTDVTDADTLSLIWSALMHIPVWLRSNLDIGRRAITSGQTLLQGV